MITFEVLETDRYDVFRGQHFTEVLRLEDDLNPKWDLLSVWVGHTFYVLFQKKDMVLPNREILVSEWSTEPLPNRPKVEPMFPQRLWVIMDNDYPDGVATSEEERDKMLDRLRSAYVLTMPRKTRQIFITLARQRDSLREQLRQVEEENEKLSVEWNRWRSEHDSLRRSPKAAGRTWGGWSIWLRNIAEANGLSSMDSSRLRELADRFDALDESERVDLHLGEREGGEQWPSEPGRCNEPGAPCHLKAGHPGPCSYYALASPWKERVLAALGADSPSQQLFRDKTDDYESR